MDLLIADATVFPGTGDLLERASVLVSDGRIAVVGRDIARPRGATVIEATGQFLMAGLIDAHTHLASAAVPERPEPHPDIPFMAVPAGPSQTRFGRDHGARPRR